jgi:hypothetical protein
MEYPICKTCGAAMGESEKHRRWHEELDRKLKSMVSDVLRELDRQVRISRLDRPH